MPSNPEIIRPNDFGDQLAREAIDDAPEPEAVPLKKAEEEKDSKPKDPLEVWRAGLAKAGVTEEQAGLILDEMLTKGYWEKGYRLYGGKVFVKFRTRDSQHMVRLTNIIDSMRAPNDSTVTEVVATANLRASLVQYRGVALPHPDPEKATAEEIEKAFNERAAFIARIPAPIVAVMRNALAKFDNVVAAALSYEAPEGF